MAVKKLLIYILLVNLSSAQLVRNFFNTILYRSDNPNEKLTKDTKKIKSEYDFIVIGSGSGGSVITNRLTEISKWDVLLIEAGKEESFMTDIPLIPPSLEVTDYNWGYKAQRQTKACLKLKNGVCNWPSGKAVGGTSVINDLLYSRGSKYDYDQWKSLGNDGWSYEDILHYFIKSERVVGMTDIDKEYHGFDGYLNVEHTPYKTKLVDIFLNSANELNYTATDINGKNPLGFAPVQSTMRNGQKCSAAKAFLRPIRNRPNFHISKQSYVTKILIDQHTKQVFGVEFRKNKKLYRIKARKEIILSAGTINSPQLLMVSGIGPKKHLQELNITVISDLPVGYNLQDHISLPGLAFLVNDSITLTGRKIFTMSAMMEYMTQRKGPYTVPGGAEAYAFVNSGTNGITNEYYSDLELILAAAALTSDSLGVIKNLLRYPDDFYARTYKGITGKEAFAFVPILMKPFSRGRIMLKSTNPYDAPLIHPNFFDDERDLKVMIEGVKMLIRLSKSPPFAAYSTHLNPQPYPGCTQPFGSDAYWTCCIQGYTSTLFHYAGTCKMGPANDSGAVVDPQLRVYGVKGLRVVDASVMPTLPAAHINAPVMMIAEKAADMVKKFWKEI